MKEDSRIGKKEKEPIFILHNQHDAPGVSHTVRLDVFSQKEKDVGSIAEVKRKMDATTKRAKPKLLHSAIFSALS